jgi:hypothetical protein
MAVRFRRSIKLAPGVRWNFSGSGTSWTLGPRGASVNIGKRGAYLNSGIPGTGFYARERLSGGSDSRRSVSPATTSVSMTCAIEDDGILSFRDASGARVPEHLVEVAKKQNKEAILGLISRKCDEINEQVEALGRLHLDTPDARLKPRFVAPRFEFAQPVRPREEPLGWLDRLFSSRRQKVEEQNAAAIARYDGQVSEWEREHCEFEERNKQRREFVESLIYNDVSAMETFLEETLHEVVWPRETLVAVDIVDHGKKVLLDVDLPEIEDMPSKLAAVPGRGLKLSVKELSATKVQRLYMQHIHGVVFRIVGETFAALPLVDTVVASGYSQRRDPGTGAMRDDYLLSLRVARQEWLKIDISGLASVDVVEALAHFDLLRTMSKTGVFKPVVPHAH